MNAEEFVLSVKQRVVDENLEIYRQMYKADEESQIATDQYWLQSKKFLDGLTEKEREVLFAMLRQVMVDTVSSLFAVLDGVAGLVDESEFVLSVADSGDQINGDLQDLFLGLEEKT